MEPNIAIVGSTGAVGEELLYVLEKRDFPVGKLRLLASKRSAGKKQYFRKKEYVIEELNSTSFSKDKVELAFFSAGSSISRAFIPFAVESGAVVVDNSSAFRMEASTPLVIPEVNPEDLSQHKGLIANPNCSTIIMLMAIAPIHKINPLKKVIVSTYQAASGAGMAAMEELKIQAQDYLHGEKIKPQVFRHPIAFNAFSHDSKVDMRSGYNEEESKMIEESHKILKDETIAVTPTCIRVSTFRAHGESIHLELENEVNMQAVTQALNDFPGVTVIDEREQNYFPMPLESSKQDEILVGRLRMPPPPIEGKKNELCLWCCGDQLLKGAALNAVQIAERLFC